MQYYMSHSFGIYFSNIEMALFLQHINEIRALSLAFNSLGQFMLHIHEKKVIRQMFTVIKWLSRLPYQNWVSNWKPSYILQVWNL